MKQIQLVVNVVFLPYFGKWLGRKWSYWGALRLADRQERNGLTPHSVPAVDQGRTRSLPLLVGVTSRASGHHDRVHGW